MVKLGDMGNSRFFQPIPENLKTGSLLVFNSHADPERTLFIGRSDRKPAVVVNAALLTCLCWGAQGNSLRFAQSTRAESKSRYLGRGRSDQF